ncbi:MAG: hypothetical protein PHV38_01330 [Eubacteriales bacterium]|mgnify:FL=1|jgi:hypothetical protein|nr:hypothetical protein [Eubacteriales bacterium]
MGDFMNKAGKVAKYAADKTGDVVEIGRCKAKITSRKSEITDLQKKIGAYYYDAYRATGETDPKVEDHLKAIEEAEKKIEELEESIKNVKNDK